MTGDPIQDFEDAEECAILFGERYNMRTSSLLDVPSALVVATARWHIRGDHDVEALCWLATLCDWQGRDSDQVARAAAKMIEGELLPLVDAFCTSDRIRTLPA